MKIIFTHAYFLEEDPKERLIMKPYPPLGLLYLSAWLEKHGMDNEVFDTTFASPRQQQTFLKQHQPDIIAIYTNLMTKINVIRLIRFIRAQDDLKQSLIVLGGPDVTYNVDNYLSTGADVIVIGEGEQTMLELAEACKKGLRPHFGHIDGIAFRSPKGDLIQTRARARIRPVDDLPFPNRKKIDLQKYLETWKKHHGFSTASLSTQRGCPYTCKWCSTAVYGQSYRRRSPALVVDEMEYLQKEYAPDQIWFVDDVFTVSHKWLQEFRDQLVERKIKIPFECISRADRLSEEIIGVLKEAGCFRIWIGAESGSQKILDAMDRRVDAGWVQKMIVAARNQGLEAGTFIMLGYPGETEEDIEITLDHLRKANPDYFTITVAYPIKGTGLYEQVEASQLQELDWMESTDRDIDFVRTYPRAYYDFAVRWVVNGLHLHKLQVQKNNFSLAALKFNLKFAAARLGMWWYKKTG